MLGGWEADDNRLRSYELRRGKSRGAKWSEK
jgi:hypothetical protein